MKPLHFAACLACTVTLAIPTGASAQQAERAAQNFRQADVNNDGALTRGEFTTFINLNADDDIGRARMIRRRGAHGRAFSRIDANKDGRITRPEMAAAAQQAR